MQYELLTLAQNFRQYLESILSSAKVLRMGVQKNPYQKTYELQAGVQDFTTNFISANRQFDWVEILMVFDKRDKHLTIYDSYNAEWRVRAKNVFEFANISEEHSTTNTLKYDTTNDLQKDLLWKQFLAWHTNGCSSAPKTDFANNPIAQELKDESEYFGDDSGERVYVDLRNSRG